MGSATQYDRCERFMTAFKDWERKPNFANNIPQEYIVGFELDDLNGCVRYQININGHRYYSETMIFDSEENDKSVVQTLVSIFGKEQKAEITKRLRKAELIG